MSIQHQHRRITWRLPHPRCCHCWRSRSSHTAPRTLVWPRRAAVVAVPQSTPPLPLLPPPSTTETLPTHGTWSPRCVSTPRFLSLSCLSKCLSKCLSRCLSRCLSCCLFPPCPATLPSVWQERPNATPTGLPQCHACCRSTCASPPASHGARRPGPNWTSVPCWRNK